MIVFSPPNFLLSLIKFHRFVLQMASGRTTTGGIANTLVSDSIVTGFSTSLLVKDFRDYEAHSKAFYQFSIKSGNHHLAFIVLKYKYAQNIPVSSCDFSKDTCRGTAVMAFN